MAYFLSKNHVPSSGCVLCKQRLGQPQCSICSSTVMPACLEQLGPALKLDRIGGKLILTCSFL